MQAEVNAAATSYVVQILGVNQAGNQTAYNDPGAFCDGRDLPLLEENAGDDVWQSWAVTYRDVYILDANNELLAVYNLTQHDLGDSANYDELKQLLIDAGNDAL
jgi:hypothetical protein